MPVSRNLRRLLTSQPIELPVFHPIAVRLQLLLETTDFTMDEVVRLCNEDQALAGQILRMANSPLYSGRLRTETIKDAVIRLGAQQVTNLAMAASQAGLHVSDNAVIDAFLQRLWQHSHACAFGAHWLARRLEFPQHADKAYMAGLLHDIGKLYLLKALERLDRVGEAQSLLAEKTVVEIFDELHVEKGCELMQHWNMPKLFFNAVAYHHDPNFDVNDKVLTVVRLVNKACRFRGIGLRHDPALAMHAEPEAALLEIGQVELVELYEVLANAQDFVP